jgi:hypothetical protein
MSLSYEKDTRKERPLILVNLSQTWPDVMAGKDSADRATLEAWAGIKDESLDAYGDAVLGIYRNQAVTAYDITGWTRLPDGRVKFTGVESKKWKHLIGSASPGDPWIRGQARPVKYLDTRVLTEGTVPVEEFSGGRRAVINGFTLAVDGSHATVTIPPGGQLAIVNAPAAAED